MRLNAIIHEKLNTINKLIESTSSETEKPTPEEEYWASEHEKEVEKERRRNLYKQSSSYEMINDIKSQQSSPMSSTILSALTGGIVDPSIISTIGADKILSSVGDKAARSILNKNELNKEEKRKKEFNKEKEDEKKFIEENNSDMYNMPSQNEDWLQKWLDTSDEELHLDDEYSELLSQDDIDLEKMSIKDYLATEK